MRRLMYFICTTNRTGSSWLCAMLRSTGVAGHVREIVHKRKPNKEWRDHLQTNPYGIKLNPPIMRLIWPLVDLEEKRSAKFVWLIRRDSWRQAISQYRAMQSHVWHVDRSKPVPEEHLDVVFDPKAIAEIRREFLKQGRFWRGFFAKNQIQPLKIEYEDLCAEPEATVRRVLGHLGLIYDGPIATETNQVLRDGLTDAWLRKLTGQGSGQFQSSEARGETG